MSSNTRLLARNFGLVTALSMLGACSAVQPANPFDQLARPDGATIQIENHNAATVSVTLEYDGGRVELGRVAPRATRAFGVEAEDRVFEFRLRASIQGAGELPGDPGVVESTYSSSLIALRHGETATWSIGFPQSGAVTVTGSH